MVGGNQVPGGDEIGTRRDVVQGSDVQANDAQALRDEYQRATDRRTVGFQPQDGTDQSTQSAGYDRSLGYDRIAVGNTPLGQRIDNITNLLAMGERSSGNLQDVNRYYGRAQKEADDLFSVAAQNVMKGREDYRGILAAKSPQEVFQGVNDSIQKQAQALQSQLQQEQDPARQRRLTQLLAVEQDRAATLQRMQQTNNPQELNRLLMYDALSAQRIDLSQNMMNERDPNKVRLMAEAETNLHTVQRAPGFTRANYGMLLMRLGQYDPNKSDNAALRAMQDAASVDPEMVPNPNSADPRRRMGDPNFMRVAADITGLQPNDPRFAQALAPIFNRDINRSPAQQYATGDQNVNPNVRYSQVQDQPLNPATDGANNRDRVQVTDQTQGVTPLVNGKTPFQRVQELAPIVAQQGLTADVRQAYASAITDSDKGTSPRVADLQSQLGQLDQAQQKIAQQIDAIQKSPEIQKLVKDGMDKLKSRPEADQQQLKQLTDALQKTQDKAQRDQILGQIGQLCPEFVQVTRLLEQKLKPYTDQLQTIQKQGEALSNDLIGELNQSSSTRMEYAEKLMKSDKPEDKQLAKQLLIESVAKAKPDQRDAFAQYAMQLGLTQQELQAGLQAMPRQDVRTQNQGRDQVLDPTQQQQQQQQQGADRTSGAGKEIDDNKKAFDGAQDKKAALAQMQGAFKKAITDADKEFSDAETKFNQLQAAHDKAANDMPADDKAKFQKMAADSTSAADKQALQKELMGKYGNIVQMEQQMSTIKDGALDLALNKFEARYEFARCSNLGGDDATAKAMMTDGLKTLTKDVGTELTAKVLEDPGVSDLAKKLGIDVNQVVQAAAQEAPQNGDQAANANAGGDLQGTLRVANARMQKGDIAGAKQAYEEAIKMVDASFNPDENNKKIKAAQDALESGNLTIDQRFQKEQEIAGYFNQAYQAFDIRSGYARVLAHPSYNQNASAEAAFKDAVAAADKVPVEAMKRQMGILANDTGTFQTAYEQATGNQKKLIEQQQAFLTDFTSTLNGQSNQSQGPAADRAWINTQINARKDLASFYVRLVTDVDEQGQPLLKPDGTPRYVPDASKVFKPEEGMKAIDEAKAKYKALYGTDLDTDPAKDPTLAILQKGIYDNSPAELQKKYQNVSRFWDEAKASIPTLIAGVGTALLMAKFKPLRALIGESAAATWGTSLIGGSAVASITNHTVMNNVLGRDDNTWARSIATGTGLTLGGVGLMKVPKLLFSGLNDAKAASIIEGGGAGAMKIGAEGKVLTSSGLAAERDLLLAQRATMGEEAFAKASTQLDNLVRAGENRTALFNLGGGAKGVKVAEFDAELAKAASGADKGALVDRLGDAVKKFAPELKIAQNAPKYAGILGERGGIVLKSPELVQKMAAADLPVITNAAGEQVLATRTVGELRNALRALPHVEPSLLGAKNAAQASTTAGKMLESLNGLEANANVADVLKNASLKDLGQLNILRNLVPEAAVEAKVAGRFSGALASFKEGSYLKGTAQLGGGVVMKGADIVAAPFKTVFGVVRPMGTKTFADLGHARFMAGSAGGATFYAGSNYLPAWQHMYGENNLDPSTGKPYEFNFSNAIVKPAWKNAADNIFVSSFFLGGMAAKPGQAILAQAPWANSRLLMKLPNAAFNTLTGSTWNYLGAKAVPYVGELGPAISTNLAMGQFDLLNNSSNRDAGRQYTDALKRAQDQIVDDQVVPKTVVPQPQQQQQQIQKPVKKPADQGQGVQQQRTENTDLTGGAPQ